MHGKIALEEHFAIEETLGDSRQFMPEIWTRLRARLLDVHQERLELMDRHGIEWMILSLNAPAVQAIPDTRRAIEVARRANDWLAAQVSRRPDRFAGLAALPMQDPEAAARELERS
ncbi:MAG TPA: amidohydrolase family protein, partial [Bryobacteraceae bacterium]|nr:amidohydrolase family protein [Bryobacteraceae bacterium]